MYKLSDLVNEIRSITDRSIRNGETLHPDWVTQEIMANHCGVDGDDADFHLCVSRETVRDQVRRQINRYKNTPESAANPDKQLVLEGFSYVQRAYLVDVKGTQVAIPIERMTSAMRKAKIDELRAMGRGCMRHADELERYDAAYPNAA